MVSLALSLSRHIQSGCSGDHLDLNLVVGKVRGLDMFSFEAEESKLIYVALFQNRWCVGS